LPQAQRWRAHRVALHASHYHRRSKRYRDAGLEEVGLLNFDILNSERDLTAIIERMAKECVESAAKL